jgi:hypothetical protein
MYAPFETLDTSARTWVYQAKRTFTPEEAHAISQALSAFTHAWVAHGNPLKTSFAILYNQFIVLAADENFNEASGCSIDSSVRVIRQIDQQFSLGLFERTNVAFLKDGVTEIIPLDALGKALQERRWNENSHVFNNVVSTIGELQTRWIIEAGQTWLKRYLPKATV